MAASFRAHLGDWLPPVLWALMIYGLSSLSQPPQPEFARFEMADKWAHMALFAGLSLLLYRALRRSPGLRPRDAVVVAFLLASAYGAADELHQYFVPDRLADPWDWVADTIGASVVFVALRTSRAAVPEQDVHGQD